MQKLLPVILLFCFLSLAASAEKKIDNLLTLSEAYRLALKRSEEIAMQAEDLQAAQARFYRSLKGVLPSVYWQTTRKDTEALESARSLLKGRLKEVESRVGIGRSRESELKTTLADLRLVEADISQARVASRAAKNLLSFYVGPEVSFESLSDDLLATEIPAAAVPPALALGPGAETRIPMAVAVIGGVVVSTFLTLFVVPCAYSVLARLEKAKYNPSV